MEKHPKVSILVPCYNHSKFVEAALDSVIADTYPNKEIVMIDDGSKDSSVDVIKKWVERHSEDISVKFHSRENRGLCNTLNELLDMAEGKYIVLMASDDMLCNNTLAERVQTLESLPEKLLLICDSETINDSGKMLHSSTLTGFHKKDKIKLMNDESMIDEMLFNFGISGAVMMADKSLYKIIGKYPGDLKAEDLYFYSRAALCKKSIYKDLIVSKYRVHDNNSSANQNPHILKAFFKTYIKLLPYIKNKERFRKVLRKIIWIFYYSFKNKRMRSAWVNFTF